MDHCSTNAACSSAAWSWEENKAFENALAVHSGDANLWEKISAAVPSRTVEEIKNRFADLYADVNAIESGLVPLPQYADSSKEASDHATRGREKDQSGKEPAESSNKEGSSQSDRGCRKGVPWSQEEHRLFLQGLRKYGKGDWRSISRHCVLSRTSTQVASHAQKFFKRLGHNSTKKTSSIHDMTIMEDGNLVNLRGQTDGTHDMAITNEENLVNLQGQTNEGKDTAQPVTIIGSSSTLDNIYARYDNNSTLDSFVDIQNDPLFDDASFDVDEYPILRHSDLDVSDYLGTDQIDMLLPWGPQTGGDIGASDAAPASISITNQQGSFGTQWPISHQMIGATDIGLMADQADQSRDLHETWTPNIRASGAAPASMSIAGQQVLFTPQWPPTHQMIGGATDLRLADQTDQYGDLHETSTLQAPRSWQNAGVPAGNDLYNMSNPGVPVSTSMVRATRFGFQGFAESSRGQMFPQCSIDGQRNTMNIEGNIINVGESPSGFSSGFRLYGPQTARQPELPPVASNVDVPSRFAPPVTATNESGASSSAGAATDLVFDEKDLDLLLSSDWNWLLLGLAAID